MVGGKRAAVVSDSVAMLSTAKFSYQQICKFRRHPEKIELVSRATLIAEYEKGGMKVPDLQSKVAVCQLERFKILASLDRPNEFWHMHALYELGS